jgi:VanZ family protein
VGEKVIGAAEPSASAAVCQTTAVDYTPSLKFREFRKAWSPVILWMALMFFASTDLMSSAHTSRFIIPILRWFDPGMSWPTMMRAQLLIRKAAHVTEYIILTGLLFRALRWSIDSFWRRAAVALVPALIFAPVDEFHQSFVPSRTASPIDVLIDYSGAALGIIICSVIHFCLTRKEQSIE